MLLLFLLETVDQTLIRLGGRTTAFCGIYGLCQLQSWTIRNGENLQKTLFDSAKELQ